jgi:phage terminase large subunit
VHVKREVYERGMSSDAITDAAIDAWDDNTEFMVVDPSAAGLIATLEARGIRVRKAVNDVKIGIATVTSMLPSLTVDPSCTNLIDEFETYSYGTRRVDDNPVKENDHALDALRYTCMELFGKPAQNWGIA